MKHAHVGTARIAGTSKRSYKNIPVSDEKCCGLERAVLLVTPDHAGSE